jgi:hypothetical protein
MNWTSNLLIRLCDQGELNLQLPSTVNALVWFGSFVQPLSHTCNILHVNYILQFIYYNTGARGGTVVEALHYKWKVVGLIPNGVT